MSQKERAKAALALTFVGDSLSMPVHWFYRQNDIVKYFPPDGITGLSAAPESHPGSIMSLHSTGRGGRGSHKPDDAVVGRLILKDKLHLWNKTGVHYHHAMPAGENTLNAWCARWMMKWLAEQNTDELSVESWLTSYVERMGAEQPAHPDTYAESYHREFFANLNKGKPLLKCGGHTHDTPSMGALVTLAPLALSLLTKQPLGDLQKTCRDFVYTTHPDETLMQVVDAYVRLMADLLLEDVNDPTELFIEAAAAVPGGNIGRLITTAENNDQPIQRLVAEDSRVLGGKYSTACYITDSWPGVCYLAARHWRTPDKALLVNTNIGGENAHRGSVLGCLIGLATGDVTRFYPQLRHYSALDAEIDCLCAQSFPAG